MSSDSNCKISHLNVNLQFVPTPSFKEITTSLCFTGNKSIMPLLPVSILMLCLGCLNNAIHDSGVGCHINMFWQCVILR